MKRVWIALGIVAVVAAGGLAAWRFYQDRPQPSRWIVGQFGSHQQVPAGATSFEISVDSLRCNPEDSALDRIEVDESGTDVTVTAYVDPLNHPFWIEGGGSDCLQTLPATVELSRPLGSRTLHVGGFPNLDPDAKPVD